MPMKYFKQYSKKDILPLVKIRQFETKLGERISTINEAGELKEALEQSAAKYVLLGIPEDIGIRANLGIGGAETAWLSFLRSFLNIQSNDFFSGENLLLLGHFDFDGLEGLIDMQAAGLQERTEAYRHAVSIIDNDVEDLIRVVCAAGKIPIVIGGGHNNSYPLIKGAAKAINKLYKTPVTQINCINVDVHSDYRPMEGRHSGNAFRYAEADGFLGKYAIVGLHENYVPQNVLGEMHENPFVNYTTYEDIFIHERMNFMQAVSHAAGFTEDNYTGIELDLDCIENVLASATTPSGISVLQARQYMNYVASDSKVAYLHICEGVAHMANGQANPLIGKLIAYLVSDFLKSHSYINGG